VKFAHALESLTIELSDRDDEIARMFTEKVQCIGFELVLNAVGKTRRADEMQRHCPMQTDAQQPIEPDKMIHMGVRYEGMANAKELAGRQRGQIAEIE
jgi:hypothetical protein